MRLDGIGCKPQRAGRTETCARSDDNGAPPASTRVACGGSHCGLQWPDRMASEDEVEGVGEVDDVPPAATSDAWDVQVEKLADEATTAAYRRHVRLAEGMDFIAKQFLRAKSRAHEALGSAEESAGDEDGMAVTLWRSTEVEAEEETVGGAFTAVEPVDGVALAVRVLPPDARPQAAHQPVLLLRAASLILVVLSALEAREKPPLSFALGVLGAEASSVHRDDPALTQLVDVADMEAGRACLVRRVVRWIWQAAETSASPGDAGEASAATAYLQLQLPLGTLQVRLSPWPPEWPHADATPLDAHIQLAATPMEMVQMTASAAAGARDGGDIPTTAAAGATAGPSVSATDAIPYGAAAVRRKVGRPRRVDRLSPSGQAAGTADEPAGERRILRQDAQRLTEAAPDASGTPTAGGSPPSLAPTDPAPHRQAQADIIPERAEQRRPAWRPSLLRDRLEELLADRQWEAFWMPVSEKEAPGYHKTVRRPMDLSTLRDNLVAGRYAQPADFAHDAERIWINADLYNRPKSAISRAAKHLRVHLERVMAEAESLAEAPSTASSSTATASMPSRPHGRKGGVGRRPGGDIEQEAVAATEPRSGIGRPRQQVDTNAEQKSRPRGRPPGRRPAAAFAEAAPRRQRPRAK